RLGLLLEGVYGFQEGGDLAPLPFAITRDSALYGVNAGLRYRLADGLHLAARLEWFHDENAANVLWGVTGATGGKVTALTLSLGWEPVPYVLIRPELKLDSYDGGGHLFAADDSGLAQHDSQLLGVLNLEFRF
ncbi:MAG: outer membrane beta-barrel protein, partial [Gammaproteobacteria bacterium]